MTRLRVDCDLGCEAVQSLGSYKYFTGTYHLPLQGQSEVRYSSFVLIICVLRRVKLRRTRGLGYGAEMGETRNS